MSITIDKLTDKTALHCHYDRQSEAQPCYIELDCKTETLRADYNGEIGNAIPFSVYHGHTQRWGIPMLTADAANGLLGRIAPLAERVVAGYDEKWDGNNHVATFTDDAQSAIEEIEALCDIEEDESLCVTEWDAGYWLQNSICRLDIDGHPTQWDHAVKTVISDYGTITHETTDDQLMEIEEKIEAGADDNVVINNLSKWLTEERDNCKQNWEYLQY